MKKALITSAITLSLMGGLAATAQLSANESARLTEAEAKTLQFMHEEEKLAKDVYLTLYNQWNIRAFSNIAGADARGKGQGKGWGSRS